MSSGTPEVNDYPFTTRGVTIGHITEGGPGRDLRFQVRWVGVNWGWGRRLDLTLFCLSDVILGHGYPWFIGSTSRRA